jgi:tripartite-type tricarboxylate transporter receptor subunit TctC
MNRWMKALAILAVAAGTAGASAADKYPARTMEMMVPWGPGGGADALGRIVARWFETDLKASMPVSNVAGAGGIVGLGRLVHAPADGHNVGVLTSDTVLMATIEPDKLRLADLAVLAVLIRQPSGFFVSADSRFKTWADVVAEASTKTVTVATTGANSPDDLAVATVASKGLKMIPIAYAKPGERYASVIGGHVDVLFEQGGDVKGFLESKTLRPLLFFSAQRLGAPFADVPVSAELGYEAVPPQVRALVVRAGTAPEAMTALSRSIARFAATPAYVEYLRDQLAEADSFRPAAGAAVLLARDVATMKAMTANLPAGTAAAK